jgi:hypothetical protein
MFCVITRLRVICCPLANFRLPPLVLSLAHAGGRDKSALVTAGTIFLWL